MNERIKLLAEQAGAEFWQRLENDVVKENAYITFDPPESLEKFAELIVRECVKFCEHESNDDEHDEYDMGMWVKAESIKAAIVKEFGIKE